MSKKEVLGKKVPASREKDYVTNKLLSVFTIAFVMIIALMNIGRMMRLTNTFRAAFDGIKIFAIVMLALTVAAVIWGVIFKFRGVDTRFRLLSPKNVAAVFGFIALCSLALASAFSEDMLRLLYILIPSVAALYILFHTFPRDFFVISATCGFGAIGVWLMGAALRGGAGSTKVWILVGAMLALIAVAVILTVVLQTGGGKWPTKRARVFFSSDDTKYPLLYIAYMLVLAAIVATWVLAGALLYPIVFALIGYLVLTGIYYAVKLF